MYVETNESTNKSRQTTHATDAICMAHLQSLTISFLQINTQFGHYPKLNFSYSSIGTDTTKPDIETWRKSHTWVRGYRFGNAEMLISFSILIISGPLENLHS